MPIFAQSPTIPHTDLIGSAGLLRHRDVGLQVGLGLGHGVCESDPREIRQGVVVFELQKLFKSNPHFS